MIAANDLRIGNWVTAPWAAYDQIKMLNGDDVAAEPIHLTREILQKAGFTWNEGLQHWTIMWGNNGIQFLKYDDYYKAFSFQLGAHQYKVVYNLHQLQNLFYCLTETELTILL